MSYTVLKHALISTASVDVCSDRIVRVVFKKEVEIGGVELKELLDCCKELAGNERYAYIYSSEDGITNLNSEAKKFGKDNPNYFHKHCMAVVVKSLAQRIMANFYLQIMRTETPYRVFNTVPEAEAWCLEILQKAPVK